MLDRVEQQFVEHHHQRGGDLGGQHAERALRGASATAQSVAATSVAALATRSTMPSNSTASSLDIESVSCTRAIEATRRTDSSSAARAAGHVHPAGLQAQQRGHGLQVVLHPVVDLPDGGVLGDQGAVPAAYLGDVADQDQRADRHPGGHQRQRPGEHGGAARVDLPARRRLAAQRGEHPVGRLGALQRVGGQPAVQRGQVLADQVRRRSRAGGTRTARSGWRR